MEKKFITKEQREKASNRLVLNFGILLAGALILLYIYNFNSAYPMQIKTFLGILGIIFALLGIAMLVLGFKKCPKFKTYSALPFGAFVPCALVSYVSKFPIYNYTTEKAIGLSLILMLVYFVILGIYTAIYLKTHEVLVEKKKIQHKKKRK